MKMPRTHTCALVACLATVALAGLSRAAGQPGGSDPDAMVRINQIQVIGTHNSYHAGLLPGIDKLLQQKAPDDFKSLDYKHADLTTQLDQGIRQIELDIFADSAGGRFAHPNGPAVVTQAGLPPVPDPYPNGIMSRPGFKVMHVQDIDYASNCQPFIACLKEVRTWSLAHPRHIPVFILVEVKQDVPDAKMQWTEPELFTSATFDALDAEIRSVFSSQELITPDQVRGKYRTLQQAVAAGNWPTLAAARGKVILLLDQQSNGPIYLKGHPSLRARVLFTNATAGQPDAAFIEANDGSKEQIDALVRKGYLVRTRSDAETVQGRNNDTRRRDEVLASGAQMISTDYPAFEPARWTGYEVALPDSWTARCNPVTATADCVSVALDATTTVSFPTSSIH